MTFYYLHLYCSLLFAAWTDSFLYHFRVLPISTAMRLSACFKHNLVFIFQEVSLSSAIVFVSVQDNWSKSKKKEILLNSDSESHRSDVLTVIKITTTLFYCNCFSPIFKEHSNEKKVNVFDVICEPWQLLPVAAPNTIEFSWIINYLFSSAWFFFTAKMKQIHWVSWRAKLTPVIPDDVCVQFISKYLPCASNRRRLLCFTQCDTV